MMAEPPAVIDTGEEEKPVFDTIRTVVITALAVGGVAIFGLYIISAGLASLNNPTEPVELRPPELAAFGVAAGTLLAANLGAVLGIAGVPNRNTWQNLRDATQSPWAQLGGAVVYVVLLLIALAFYWMSDWSENAAEALKTSLGTLFGVLLGAMTAVFGTKP